MRDPYIKLREVMAMLPEPERKPLAIGPAPVKPKQKQQALPMRIPPVQQQLALGFFTEPQAKKSPIIASVPAHPDELLTPRQFVESVHSTWVGIVGDGELETHAAACRCGGPWVEDPIAGRHDAYCDHCGAWRSDPFGHQKESTRNWEGKPDGGFRSKVTTPAQRAQNPPKRASRAVKAADDQAEPKASPRGCKEPAGHVWWVSERWSARYQSLRADMKVKGLCGPASGEFELIGMQLENANGQNRGSMGAMHAYMGREKKRRQWALTSATVNAASFIGWPVRITLVRVAPNAVDDDNLGQMFKRVRDGICEALGFRDDKRREGFLDWKYEQRKGGNRADTKKGVSAVHHVIVRVEVMT